MKPPLAFVLLAAIVSTEGCGTLRNHVALGDDGGEARPYGGVLWDVDQSLQTSHTTSQMFLLDVPFSFVGDTLLLPYDLFSH